MNRSQITQAARAAICLYDHPANDVAALYAMTQPNFSDADYSNLSRAVKKLLSKKSETSCKQK